MVSHIEGQQRAGALKQRWHQGCQAERVEDEMLDQNRLHHQIRVCEVWGEHVWGQQSQTEP